MKRIAYIRTTEIYNDSRATKEIKALLEAGLSVDVFLWDRNGKSKDGLKTLFGDFANIKFHIFDMLLPNGMGIKNIDKLFKWKKWVEKELKRAGKFDYLHVCNLDSGIAIKKYCKKNDVRVVYDIYDYYVDSHSIPGCLKNYIEKSEIKIINDSYTTIICTEERKEQIEKSNPSKVVVIHNTPDISDMGDFATEQNKYDYIYCGQLGYGRLIEEIFNEYENNADMRFCIVGGGAYASKAAELSEKYENFTYLGTLPYSEVLKEETSSTVISAIYDPSKRNHRLCAPNKFYESLALGKPIIVCKGTGIDKIVESNSIGETIDYDAKQFFEKLRKITADNEMILRANTEGKRLYNEQYHWDIMKKRLTEIYE